MKFKKVIILGLLTITILFNGMMPVYANELESTLPSGVGYEEIGAKIEEYVAGNQATTAAMEVAVFDTDEIIYKNYFGYADIENGYAAGGDTVFEWGSISKLLVWVSVMQLWEQGKIDLDKDIRTYLPDGFLTNLNYDEPVTMLNLMNHNAGFQEVISDLFLKDMNDVLSLGGALRAHEPEQIYEPGTVTAYSNWGVALAGYIVECVSGESYYRYVHRNIFEPLNMEHTAVAVDLSDNEWVRQQRNNLQCYTGERQLIPNCFFYIPLYPAGMCTGTLDDFAAFAQALLPKDGKGSLLFEKESTLDELLSPTAYYGDTDIVLNCHGLWTEEFGISVLGHGGNTAGSSSMLLFNPESGIGAVVMTNQQYEIVYNHDMFEFIFGSFPNSQYADYNSELPGGFYRSARTITKGPMSLYSLSLYRFERGDLDTFWVYVDNGSLVKVVGSYGDMLRLGTAESVIMMGLALLLAFGLIYSVVTLVVGGCILAPIRRRKRRKLGLPKKVYRFRKWNYIACALELLLFANVALIVVQAFSYAPSGHYVWQFAMCGILGLAMVAYILLLIIMWKKLDCPVKEKAKYIITAILMLVSVIAILYWQMYKFWAL